MLAVSTALAPASQSPPSVTAVGADLTTTTDSWLIERRIVPAGGLITHGLTQSGYAAADTASASKTRLPDPSPTVGTTQTRPPIALAATTSGGRTQAAEPPAPADGLGFDSPLGRFAVTSSGVLLAGSDDGSASVSLVAPAGLVGGAALLGLLAILGQRRADRRRRVVP